MEREDKMKMTCSPEQLAEILRSMADAMERERLSLDTVELAWNSVEKISLTIRNAAGMADVKVRITSGERTFDLPEDLEDDEGVGDDVLVDQPRDWERDQDQIGEALEAQVSDMPQKPGKPRGSYGSLKKRMKKSFKNIMYSLHENIWPSQVDIDEFLRDSADMVRYPGKGDEFYPAYTEAVAAFADAVQRKDLEAAYQATHVLNTLKTQCHKKYD
ncbi:GAK system XXXCH domain-containing protein [Desulfonatronum thiodismutans]|uniref:GAK system XXXCH domain-containing protein n=1 Tax=Desulfonatronum thiodismutans TaxID=159290 RepID=UPI00068F8EFA|nr:GAK system XXXCH domain-containing protein [Desulfonatronum thiodismutans]